MSCRIRPDLCGVGLFPLNFRHLPDGMLFARYRKQRRRKENSEDTLTKEGTHNSLAQLSASAAMRKEESAVAATANASNHSITITIQGRGRVRGRGSGRGRGERKSCD